MSRDRPFITVLLLPAFFFLGLFYAYPMLFNLQVSLTDLSLFGLRRGGQWVGIGNYVEADVYAAARVFTGFNWQINGDRASTTGSWYSFRYVPNDHDTTAKTFTFAIGKSARPFQSQQHENDSDKSRHARDRRSDEDEERCRSEKTRCFCGPLFR